jgi:hypothetical protein
MFYGARSAFASANADRAKIPEGVRFAAAELVADMVGFI